MACSHVTFFKKRSVFSVALCQRKMERMGHQPFCPFLARHHLDNVKQKRPVLIRRAKIGYV